MRDRAQLGMAMFLISEGVFFFLLLLAFVYFRAPGSNLSLGEGATGTVLLAASSFSMWRAAKGSRLLLWVTMALGGAFLALELSQYVRLIRDGITMSQGLFGTTFFTLTGVHALHVFAGIIALAILPSAALRVMALYWHFFVVLWLAIFLVAFVWGGA